MSLESSSNSSSSSSSNSVGENSSELVAFKSTRIERILFDGKDFPSWKFKFVAQLMGIGLLGIVEGTEARGANFEARRDFAYSMLVLSMTDSTMKFAMSVDRGDAAGVWRNLHAEFERNTRANKIGLRRQLYQIINMNYDIDDIVAKIHLLCSRLLFLKVKIDDGEKLAVLLSAAGKRYESMVTIIEMIGDELLYSEAVEKIKDYALRNNIEREREEDSRVASALKVDLKQIRCYNCQKFGHYARDCPSKKMLEEAAEANQVNVKDQGW